MIKPILHRSVFKGNFVPFICQSCGERHNYIKLGVTVIEQKSILRLPIGYDPIYRLWIFSIEASLLQTADGTGIITNVKRS